MLADTSARRVRLYAASTVSLIDWASNNAGDDVPTVPSAPSGCADRPCADREAAERISVEELTSALYCRSGTRTP